MPTDKCVLFLFEKRYYFCSFLAVVSKFGPLYYLIIIIIIIRSREPPTTGWPEENASAATSQRNHLRVLLSHNYNYTSIYMPYCTSVLCNVQTYCRACYTGGFTDHADHRIFFITINLFKIFWFLGIFKYTYSMIILFSST